MFKNLCVGVFVFAVFVSVTSVFATPIPVVTLTDLNTTVIINPSSQAGMSNWVVDDVAQLSQQWFWFRVGYDAQKSVDTISPPAIKVSDTNFNDGEDTVVVNYAANAYQVSIIFSLTGGEEGTLHSDVAETIKIHNSSASVLDFHFYQFVNMDLGSNGEDDTVGLRGSPVNTAEQHDGQIFAAETVVTPSPSHYEINLATDLLNKLNSTTAVTLSDSSTPLTGDVAWAFQWDFQIPAGGTVIISKDKLIVPEPATLAFLAMAANMIAIRRKK